MPRTKSQRGTVFISHSNKDRDFVVRLSRVLNDYNVRYWYSAAHIIGAEQWHDEIGRALRRCDWFLIVLTPNAVRSEWVKHELLFALREDRYKERIIPLLRKACKYERLSWTLSESQRVDFAGNFDLGCRQLLRIWKMNYKPTTHKIQRQTKKRK